MFGEIVAKASGMMPRCWIVSGVIRQKRQCRKAGFEMGHHGFGSK